jgi:hypothetical protein
LRIIAQPDFARAVRADLDQLVLADVVPRRKATLVGLILSRNEIDDPEGGADVFAWRGDRRHSAAQQRRSEQTKKSEAHDE